MTSVYILFDKYFDFGANHTTIGGIQTYITDLCAICQSLGYKTRAVQIGDEYQSVIVDGIEIIQIVAKSLEEYEDSFFRTILPKINQQKDIVIYATDTMIFDRISFSRSIAIQHGIYWDIPSDKSICLPRILLSRSRMAYRMIKHHRKVKSVVCVDYNFLNWLRTQVDYTVPNYVVIPNYSVIAPVFTKSNSVINIMFARRLWPYRGTRIFTNAVQRLLDDDNTEVTITIAGSGPDENWMKSVLGKYSNVIFTEYESSESLEMHKDKHIAVIPTIGSEGTSLSLLEAMSSQCAVVCTNVGGMSNIVIDQYNGLMINPDEDSLYFAIRRLVMDSDLRDRLSHRAYETVKDGFSYDLWKNRWEKLLQFDKDI